MHLCQDSVPEHVLWLQFSTVPDTEDPASEKILRTFQNQPFNLCLPKEPRVREGRQGCWCQELPWETAEFPPLAPQFSVNGSAGAILVEVTRMISLSAPRYPLPRLEEGRVTHFSAGSRHFLVCPPSPFTPQNICSFWIHCCSHLPGSMMSLLTSC